MSPLYLIAILTSEEINEQILEWKNYMLQHFNCKVALRSPAHITLIPPFHVRKEHESQLVEELQLFARSREAFHVTVSNFSSFPPRVIFAGVIKTPELDGLKADIQQFFISSTSKIKADNRPFHPHITIANRDLQKTDYKKAWEYFQRQTYEAVFPVDAVYLLRSSPAGWQTIARCPFEALRTNNYV